MDTSSLAGWAGATATTAATIAALYLGGRDEEARGARAAARRRVRSRAQDGLRLLRLWEEGLQGNGFVVDNLGHRRGADSVALDRECSEWYADVACLAGRRRRRGLALLRGVFGSRSVLVAELLPERFANRNAVVLLKDRPDLLADGIPAPLWRRAADEVGGKDFERLRALYRRLARL